MKCLDTEKLVGYAYGLLDEAAAAPLRGHLAECLRCRQIVEQHARLNAVLDEWKGAEPSPAFDARLRQALEAQESRRHAFGLWSWQWARGLALASLGVVLIAGALWFTRSPAEAPQRGQSGGQVAARVPTRPPQAAVRVQGPAQSAKLDAPAAPTRVSKRFVPAVPETASTAAIVPDDKDIRALEDYDLAANLDPLSELPKGEQKVSE